MRWSWLTVCSKEMCIQCCLFCFACLCHCLFCFALQTPATVLPKLSHTPSEFGAGAMCMTHRESYLPSVSSADTLNLSVWCGRYNSYYFSRNAPSPLTSCALGFSDMPLELGVLRILESWTTNSGEKSAGDCKTNKQNQQSTSRANVPTLSCLHGARSLPPALLSGGETLRASMRWHPS